MPVQRGILVLRTQPETIDAVSRIMILYPAQPVTLIIHKLSIAVS